jgi:hypothetical protein
MACGGGDSAAGEGSGRATPESVAGAPGAFGGASTPQGAGGTAGLSANASPASPQAKQVGVLVPAYFTADTGSSPWSELSAARQNYPDVPVTAILNPNNGAFSNADPNYVKAMADFTAKGGKVVGYVRTGYGGRSMADVEANVDNYVKDYPRYVSGIFLDEMSADPGELPFYQAIADYIRQSYPNLQIIGNPGTYPNSGYANVADILTVFENAAAAWSNASPAPDNTWVFQRESSGQATLAYETNCNGMQNMVADASSSAYNVGWVYATDRQYDSDPWAGLPNYWMKLLGTVDADNKGESMPSC